MDLVLMDFQARAGLTIADVDNPFAPSRVGVGVISKETAEHPALLGVYLEGCFPDSPDAQLSFMVALDTERAAGLLVQIPEMLADAGVSAGVLAEMMVEARKRMQDVRAMDRAPEEET